MNVAAIRAKKRATDARKNSKRKFKFRVSVANNFKMIHYAALSNVAEDSFVNYIGIPDGKFYVG